MKPHWIDAFLKHSEDFLQLFGCSNFCHTFHQIWLRKPSSPMPPYYLHVPIFMGLRRNPTTYYLSRQGQLILEIPSIKWIWTQMEDSKKVKNEKEETWSIINTTLICPRLINSLLHLLQSIWQDLFQRIDEFLVGYDLDPVYFLLAICLCVDIPVQILRLVSLASDL